MKSILFLAAALNVARNLRRQEIDSAATPALAEVRQRLAETLDSLRNARDGNEALRFTVAEYGNTIAERNATITALKQERARCDQSIVDLVKALNAANVSCAALRGQLSRCGSEPQGYYFMTLAPDGSVVGPFSRS